MEWPHVLLICGTEQHKDSDLFEFLSCHFYPLVVKKVIKLLASAKTVSLSQKAAPNNTRIYVWHPIPKLSTFKLDWTNLLDGCDIITTIFHWNTTFFSQPGRDDNDLIVRYYSRKKSPDTDTVNAALKLASGPLASLTVMLSPSTHTHTETHPCRGTVGSHYHNIFIHHIAAQHMALCTAVIGGAGSAAHARSRVTD